MAQQSAAGLGRHGSRYPGLSASIVKYRSQLVAYPYFSLAVLLFLLQIPFGLLMAAQYVWPTLLLDVLPFNVARATHLNLLILWLLLGLMGASYYMVSEETESDIYSVRLAYGQLGILALAGVGTLLSFWFFPDVLGSIGKPFVESPYPWPWLIAFGVVLFLGNMGVTLFRSRRWNPITGILFAGTIGLAGMYLLDMVFFENLTVDFYWWWWIIHLWVEGAWELIAAAVMAFLLVRMTGVPRQNLYRWLYLEAGLVLFTGILGTGHHYYWIGTPEYWLGVGAVFGALEPVPILLMAIDAYSHLKRTGAEPVNRVAFYWLGGSALMHFFGAGIYGFAQTLPVINKWTHGTQITASHGHFAFFGAFAMLVIGAIYYMFPRLRGLNLIREAKGKWGFWLMLGGISGMVLSFTIAGVVQVYLWRLIGLDFMTVRTGFVSFWIFWVFFFGLVLFLPGVVAFVWDFFAAKAPEDDSSRRTGL